VKWLYAIGGVFLLFHLFTDLFISGHYNYFWGLYPKAGLLHPGYLLLTSYAFMSGVVVFKKHWDSATSAIQLNQIKYVAVSFTLYFFAAIDFAANYGVEFYPPGFGFIISSLILISYAIAKHNVLDIHFVVKKTIYYSALLALLIVPCTAIIFLAEKFTSTHFQIAAYSLLQSWLALCFHASRLGRNAIWKICFLAAS
jgi:hypothetical protein